jgi:hypothetical protein
MRNTLPPLASNDLLGNRHRRRLAIAIASVTRLSADSQQAVNAAFPNGASGPGLREMSLREWLPVFRTDADVFRKRVYEILCSRDGSEIHRVNCSFSFGHRASFNNQGRCPTFELTRRRDFIPASPYESS